MGGQKSDFPTTRWSEIGAAGADDQTRRSQVIDSLAAKYWKPVYCYLRRRGYANDPAKDLTQGFFCELVLGQELIRRANKAKGRFRTFLLTALNHYVSNIHRAQLREKRHPKGTILSLQEFDEPSVSLTAKDMKPDEAFTYVWALELLQEVLAEVETGCRLDGKTKHWEVFRARVLEPIMHGAKAKPLGRLCAQLLTPV